MTHYRRLPALLVLLVVFAMGTLYARSSARPDGAAGGGLADLEKTVASGKADSATWLAYAKRLTEANRHEQAALAYRKVLDAEPNHREARLACALALAQARNEEEFLNFMRDLAYGEPKLAVEIFDRPECQPLLASPRVSAMQKEARAQAMD